ncbi:chromosome transmission fidelity factor [Lasallia pustulata]|uniref:Replication factor C subunit 1 n=1 Tax=Lasallia pustulata TaxID=136370 RepID=A0A1W5CZ27_9LECA|nr:chromosome transmission fidelity factor [Lasallia pustulata]
MRLQAKAAKAKGRGKRKVVSDSEEEAQVVMPKKSTPKKPNSKKPIKRESPNGEVTTTTDYFASTGKSRPSRSTPTKPKAPSEKKITASTTKNTPAKSTPKPKATPTSRASSRRKAKANYTEPQDDEDDEDDTAFVDKGDDSADDIFAADFKNSRQTKEDKYNKEDDSEEEVAKPKRKGVRAGKPSPLVDQEDQVSAADEDVTMKDTNPDDDFVVPDAKEEIQVNKSINGVKARDRGNTRKRKSADSEVHDEEKDEEEEDFDPPAKKPKSIKPKSPAKPPPAKKPRTSAHKDDVPESREVQEIFDSIPLVRPPTPPAAAAGEPKKFDYRNTGSRSQPAPAAGSKEIPIGAENCLAGLTFVFTGLLDALGRDEGQALIKRYGGKVTGAPSTKTSYVVLGNDAGPKKLETIAKHNIKTINEDGLFELIRRLPANGGDSKAAEKFAEKQQQEAQKVKDMAAEMEKEERRTGGAGGAGGGNAIGARASNGDSASSGKIDNRLWTVKYAPTAPSMMCGNKGQIEKLQTWLRAWPSNAKTHFKKAGKDGSGVFRAVMIHGPPGIGKTTAAHLIAKLEGYDIVESNASDTRSKKLVETGLKGVLDTTSLLGYFAGDGKKVDADKKKLVLIMDEVDGMSAGDRGGVGALAAVCKKTSVPMILICNERKLPKMKPFDYNTYDLPFRKPTTEQVRARMSTICFREGLRMPPNVLDALIEGSRADIRQIINMISTAKLDQETMDFDQGKQMSKAWEKHVILKPWDIVSKILGGGMFAQSSNSTLNDKIELYFNDHEFSSLMLQENYLKTSPTLAASYSGKERALKLLELSDKAAESISDGDLVDRMIHGSQQQWSLMPTHAVFSFVRPASFVAGSQAGHGPTNFTSWLGNNSKQGKLMRFIKEIQGHMRLRASGDRHEIRQQYLPLLWYKLIGELEKQGKDSVKDMIKLMDSYFLTKEDYDAIMELGVGPMDMENVKIDSATKAAFTRLYNQKSHPLPFMKASNVLAPKKASKERPDLEEAIDASDEGEEVVADAANEDEEENLDLKKDKYVRAPPKKAAPKKKAPSKAKGKAKEDLEDELDEDESEEDVKPKKGKGSGRGKATPAAGRGRGRK